MKLIEIKPQIIVFPTLDLHILSSDGNSFNPLTLFDMPTSISMPSNVPTKRSEAECWAVNKQVDEVMMHMLRLME